MRFLIKLSTKQSQVVNKFFVALVIFYQKYGSPLKPNCCRFYPSCSEYAKGSIHRYGFLRGGIKTLLRILRCHPFHPGGYDPI